MKKFFHKMLSFSLAIVVLFSTMSFVLDIHYCGDSMADFSFKQSVKTCGMENMDNTSSCEKDSVQKSSCCTEHQLIVQGQEDLDIASNQSLLQQQFTASFIYTFLGLSTGWVTKTTPFVAKPLPFIERDVQVLHQTFLI